MCTGMIKFRLWLTIAAVLMTGAVFTALMCSGCSVGNFKLTERLQADQKYLNDSANAVSSQQDNSKPTILIAAAASLEPVMKELELLYLKKDRPADLSFSFASSGSLQMQIEQGARVDVLVTAAAENMDQLEQQGLLRQASRQDLLYNELALVADSDSKIDSFDDLETDMVKHLGLGSPESVPAGFYASQLIENLMLEQAISGKEVFAKDVSELIFWVQGGHVDAAIVYMTDASFRDGLKVICKAPAGSHDRIVYPAAIISGSVNPEESQEFIDFLGSEAAGLIFEKYGFTVSDN